MKWQRWIVNLTILGSIATRENELYFISLLFDLVDKARRLVSLVNTRYIESHPLRKKKEIVRTNISVKHKVVVSM